MPPALISSFVVSRVAVHRDSATAVPAPSFQFIIKVKEVAVGLNPALDSSVQINTGWFTEAVFIFVNLADGTALATFPLESRPAFALAAPPDIVEAATLLTLAVSAAVFALVTSAPSE